MVPTQIPDDELVHYNCGSVNTMYVTAIVGNMSGDQWEKEIVIGDETIDSHNGLTYYNAPLDKDLTYYIFIRAYAYSHNKSVSYIKDIVFIFALINSAESKVCIKWLIRSYQQ